MVFGEGAPKGFLAPNLEVKAFSAAFDVVAHELTHGVTGNSASLNGFPLSEAGALNEGFSDIFGVSTTFFYQPAGSGPLQASYLLGKDLTVPSGAFCAIAQQSCVDRRSGSLHPPHHRRRSALQFDDSQSRLLSGD